MNYYLLLGFSCLSESAQEMANESGFLEIDNVFLTQCFGQNFESIMSYPEQVENTEWCNSFNFPIQVFNYIKNLICNTKQMKIIQKTFVVIWLNHLKSIDDINYVNMSILLALVSSNFIKFI